ncbi:hypothetical protein [Legionella maioricensis]|uniref:Uncharacterized protein n=1 Tax=Legionella maioricensis TaxID=2896528 RepID=A0A9X2D302_9GAMM|nr:hypothetical protein [Legionella maioricensis]MCL9685750.1 hypothetical protein [Legionella maioricensis]MCL9686448.1 hypothetical protein [Legionella maioricensis]
MSNEIGNIIPNIFERKRILMNSGIQRNPFFILNVNVRDDRKKIVQLTEEKSLEFDHYLCQKARSDLTHPRNRLSAELAWLSGVSPGKASLLIEQLLSDPMSIRSESGIPVLAHINLLASVFYAIDIKDDSEDVSEFILQFVYLIDQIKIEDVMRDINEDRLISGFPKILKQEQIVEVLAEQNQYYKTVIKDGLNRLDPLSLIKVITSIVSKSTNDGEIHAPSLIDELIDSYEIECKEFLQEEEENITQLIKVAKESKIANKNLIGPILDKLETVVMNWSRVIYPILISAKSRGLENESINKIAYLLLHCAAELGTTDCVNRINFLVKGVYSNSNEIMQLIQKIEEEKQNEEIEFEREISYQAEIGLINKTILSISPDGIIWKNQHYALDAITRIRWGGVKNSINGIPTGTNYTIAFGDNNSEAIINLRRREIYSTFIDKLWRAVGVRLSIDLLHSLKGGKEFKWGNSIIKDDGITIYKTKFFGGSELISCSWDQVNVWSSDGNFCIGMKNSKNTFVTLSYANESNIHVLERVIDYAFTKPEMKLLSDVL